ncbi:MAG TPA: c-type cytochrome [Terriglobales bacterium]|nr:c-type cytochrome [Terriglobales bacterium]
MKKVGKILLIAAVVLVVFLAVAITVTIGWRPLLGPKARALTNRKFESTPQRLARGKYLVDSVSGCSYCHSEHDWANPAEPMLPGMECAGEKVPFVDLPGEVTAPNLTPDPQTGAGNWSDDQLARAIREGIGHDGRTLFPMMPYGGLRHMSDEDLASVIVYLRSLPPVHHELPQTKLIFPIKYLIRNAPEPVTEPVSSPDPSNRVAWGKYMLTLAGCNDCHTPTDRGKNIAGMMLAGGVAFKTPWAQAAAANITPDPSGISYYDEATFLKAMHTGYVGARKLSRIMPTDYYTNMTDDDLKAIYAYLRTVPPVKHRVDNSLPVTYCKLCRQWHGAGNQN